MEDETKKLIRMMGYLSTLGMAMAFSIVLGALLGYYLDSKLDTKPWLFFIFLGFGIIAAFRNLYIMYNRTKDL